MPRHAYLTEAQYQRTAYEAVNGEMLRSLVECRDEILPLVQRMGLRLASHLHWNAFSGQVVNRDTSIEAVTMALEVAVDAHTDFCTVTHFHCSNAFNALLRAQMALFEAPSDAYMQG